jgi:hypothetical protein
MACDHYYGDGWCILQVSTTEAMTMIMEKAMAVRDRTGAFFKKPYHNSDALKK